jgi:hypothetical protein
VTLVEVLQLVSDPYPGRSLYVYDAQSQPELSEGARYRYVAKFPAPVRLALLFRLISVGGWVLVACDEDRLNSGALLGRCFFPDVR